MEKALGWNGNTLKKMLEESEKMFEESGRYYALDTSVRIIQ